LLFSSSRLIAALRILLGIAQGCLLDNYGTGILNMVKCALQGAGFLVALLLPGMAPLYIGFFIYGIDTGGTAVLAETIWAEHKLGGDANGAREAVSVAAAIGVRGCLDPRLRTGMMSGLVFGFPLNL
jgi:hypothetical protein